jgi:hypothetical protein
MRVGDRDRECVGGIGLHGFVHVQQDADHVLHLFLAGVALADHRLLDRVGRVLADRQPVPDHRADRRAPRLPQLQRGVGVFGHEHALDRRLAR